MRRGPHVDPRVYADPSPISDKAIQTRSQLSKTANKLVADWGGEKMLKESLRIGLLAIAAIAAIAATPAETASYPMGWGSTASRILGAHNRERARLGIAPLQWDPALAAAAASYGPTLARLGRLQHSPRADRQGQRENLWMGTRGAYSPEQMVGGWIAERAYYRPGMPFPYVSRTGNWADVAHYTQVVWRGTTRVGCAIVPSRQWDFLICRYSPPGNIDGRPVA